MITKTSDIDANLASRVFTLEHFNYLPPQEALYSATSSPDYNAPFPFPPTDKSMLSRAHPSASVLELVRVAYPESPDFPITTNTIRQFKKFHVAWKCTIGTVTSQDVLSKDRRDDSKAGLLGPSSGDTDKHSGSSWRISTRLSPSSEHGKMMRWFMIMS
jgi:hypothetical protein